MEPQAFRSGRWTRGPIVATLPVMSEDDPKPAPEVAAELANPLEGTTEASEPGAPPPDAAPVKVNKLHEWGAALVIMAVLSLILFMFLFFLRGASI